MGIEGSELVLGIDGGGSRTRAWLARLDGTVIGSGQAGPANVFQLGVKGASESIVRAAEAAWAASGGSGSLPRALNSIFAGVAGAGARHDQEVLAGALAVLFRSEPARCRVDHDMRIALAGGLEGAPGAVLIAGTGSVCYGRLADGRSWRAGGFGAVLDDGGSGHWLGLQALRLVVRVADGRAGASPLADAVAARLGLRGPRDVLRFVHNAGDDRSRIAGLAPLVLAAFDAADGSAIDIVSRGSEELAAMAEAVWRPLELDRPGAGRLAGAGGLLECGGGYRRMVEAAIAKRVPAAALEMRALPPCAGAVMLALEHAGRPVVADVIVRLKTKAAAEAAAC